MQSSACVVLITVSASGVRRRRPLPDTLLTAETRVCQAPKLISAIDAPGFQSPSMHTIINGYIATCAYLQAENMARP